MPDMQYLVSFALLVAFAAWIVGVYNQLDHLRHDVCASWLLWCKATHQRNTSLVDFASGFAAFLPQQDSRPRYLKRLADDSEHAVALALEPHWGSSQGCLISAEQVLRRAVADSVAAVETSPEMREHVHLQQLCSRVSSSLYQQDQYAALFDRAAVEYNSALSGISARMLAPVFGFARVETLSSSRQNTRSA